MEESHEARREAGLNGTVIAVEDVRHVYRGGTLALDGVSLEIGTGLFGLLGPNGAGKSTLMRIICTLLTPTGGTVRVGGHDVVRTKDRVRPMIGYLPQEFGGWRLQRVEEVVDTLAALSGFSDAKKRQEKVEAALKAVGLAEYADRKVKKLSGGMVRRLGVAQALVHEPPVLVVDEPTVGLDPEERIHFRQMMSHLAEERVIVLSTHIVADLGSGCVDMALIDEGKLVFRGSPAELTEQARGRVFEMTAGSGGEMDLGPDTEIVSRFGEGSETRVRAVSGTGVIAPRRYTGGGSDPGRGLPGVHGGTGSSGGGRGGGVRCG